MSIDRLKLKIATCEARISVIGLGYVGLPLSLRFAEKGFSTYGIDIDKTKIEQIKSGKSYINHIKKNDIAKAIKSKFSVHNDFKKISSSDVIIICVPTPLDDFDKPDTSFILKTLKFLGPHLKPNQILILESTSFPGTTEEILVPFIDSLNKSKKSNLLRGNSEMLNLGENFFLGYSPEREDPANQDYQTKDIPKVVSGWTQNCLIIIQSLYDKIVIKTVPVSSTKVAEMTKLLENTFRAVNIGLINELKLISMKIDVDIFEVIEAAKTKPFGFMPYYPGPGLGGHCIPIDPLYLSWKANEVGFQTKFINLANEINKSMPDYIVNRVNEILNKFDKKISKSKILVLGLSYKKNIDDVRESPSLEIINKLINCGADVNYSDPFFSNFPVTRKFKFNLKCIKLDKKNINNHDLVLIACDHDCFDYNLIKNESNLIIDTRGRIEKSKKAFKA